MDCSSRTDILKQALENGIIDMDSLCMQLEELNRNRILKEVHTSKIWCGKSQSKGRIYNYYYTYLPDRKKPGKKKLIKRSTLEKLEDTIVEHYSSDNESHEKLFRDVFSDWLEFKSKIVSDGTVYHYRADYKRFFKDTDFENTAVSAINEETILAFLSDRVKRLELTQRAMKALGGYINEVLESAVANRYISSNPYTLAKPKLRLIAKQCVLRKPKSEGERTLTPSEIKALVSQLYREYERKPGYISPYAIELALLTGMRIGELSALRWSDITDVITVRSSEKAHRPENGSIYYTVEGTKTGRERQIPLTAAMSDLFRRIAEAEKNAGYSKDTEFVFINGDGRIKSVNIDRCLERKCKQAGIERKTIHDIRRTVNSALRGIGVTAPVAASLMGHTPEVNENYYTYDTSELESKRLLLEQAAASLISEAV